MRWHALDRRLCMSGALSSATVLSLVATVGEKETRSASE